MNVELTKVSDHGRTRRPAKNTEGYVIGKTQEGHSMWTIAWGEGSDRQSKTMHCSEQEAQAEKSRLKG